MQGQRHPFVVLLCASSVCGSADQLLMASVVTASTVTGFTCVPLRTVVKIARISETIHQSKWAGIWTTASYPLLLACNLFSSQVQNAKETQNNKELHFCNLRHS